VVSPNGRVQIRIEVAEGRRNNGPAAVHYAVDFDGQPVIVRSALALATQETGELLSAVTWRAAQTRVIDETWRRPWGKRPQATERARELTLELTSHGGAPVALIFRAADDGASFRYQLPGADRYPVLHLTAERTEFNFASDAPVWAARQIDYKNAQETEFSPARLAELDPERLIQTPLLVQPSAACWAAVLEADRVDWAGLWLRRGAAPNQIVSDLAPRPGDKERTLVLVAERRLSPWRVIMLADRPGGLIESDRLQNLAEPCRLADTSWIKPGRCAWDWWWPGRYAPAAKFALGANDDTMRYFIDFAAEMGWEYQLVDWYWYGAPFSDMRSFTPDMTRDITRCAPGIDVPALVRYAAAKHVRLVVWLQWAHVAKQMEEAFALYEKWGVAGVKIDFMDRNDQEMTQFYERVAACAARHRLLVDFHGAYLPDGRSRTWPNLITREGVLGNEYNKWSSRVTPAHCVTLPFTRMLGGEMDFTPGGFRHSRPEEFKSVGEEKPAPRVMGTRCFQLAMPVVYESAFTVYCDSPDAYRGQPGAEFYREVPTTWDETRVLDGFPGTHIVIARRSGARWFVAGMNAGPGEREFTLASAALGAGAWHAQVWRDAADAAANLEKIETARVRLAPDAPLALKMAPAGGFVAILSNDTRE